MNTSQIKRRTATIVPQSFSSTVHDSLAMSSTLTNTTQHPSYLATSLYSTINSFSRSGNGSYDEDDFDCLQYPFSSYGHEAFKLFELFIRKLNDTKHLYHILHHWVTGNRLILKYTNLIGNQDLIRALASVFQVRLITLTRLYRRGLPSPSYFYLMAVAISSKQRTISPPAQQIWSYSTKNWV